VWKHCGSSTLDVDVHLNQFSSVGALILAVLHDVTQRRSLEQLRRLRKWNRSAGSRGRRLTSTISSRRSSATASSGGPIQCSDPAREAREIRRAEAGRRLTQQLLAFSRKQVVPEVLDLGESCGDSRVFSMLIGGASR
jgi:hypothetical protein